MGTAEVNARAAMAAERCECGHSLRRHEVPGFDGECIADGCNCTLYRARVTIGPVTVTALPPRAPRVSRPPAAVPSGIEQMIARGKRSGSKRTRALVERIESAVSDLYGRLRAERTIAESLAALEAAKTVVAAPLPPVVPLPAEDLEAPVERPAGAHPCPVDGCGFTAARPQGLASHRRNAHGNVPTVACPDCGKPCKALGPHRYHAHGIRAAS